MQAIIPTNVTYDTFDPYERSRLRRASQHSLSLVPRVASTRHRPRRRTMNTGDIAREQIRDRVRDAEAFRRSRSSRTAQLHERRAVARKVYSGVLAALATPFRH
jgi:hypothetical protein